jgi:hypothetical protein
MRDIAEFGPLGADVAMEGDAAGRHCTRRKGARVKGQAQRDGTVLAVQQWTKSSAKGADWIWRRRRGGDRLSDKREPVHSGDGELLPLLHGPYPNAGGMEADGEDRLPVMEVREGSTS